MVTSTQLLPLNSNGSIFSTNPFQKTPFFHHLSPNLNHAPHNSLQWLTFILQRDPPLSHTPPCDSSCLLFRYRQYNLTEVEVKNTLNTSYFFNPPKHLTDVTEHRTSKPTILRIPRMQWLILRCYHGLEVGTVTKAWSEGAQKGKIKNSDACIAESEDLIGDSMVVPAEEHGYAASEYVEARFLLLCNHKAPFSKAGFPARLRERHGKVRWIKGVCTLQRMPH